MRPNAPLLVLTRSQKIEAYALRLGSRSPLVTPDCRKRTPGALAGRVRELPRWLVVLKVALKVALKIDWMFELELRQASLADLAIRFFLARAL
jgi:hypothetical protein